VSVLSSTAAASGLLPTLAVATTRQSGLTLTLHVAVLITSTTWPGEPEAQKLVAHWTGT
jgi:hypothetical protein